MTSLRDKIARALAEWHGGPDAEPWIYDMHTESADAVLAVLDLDQARAVAWDEGYWLGINGYTGPGNPYRAGLYRKEEQ